MILLDTHMWIWWVQADSRLTASQLGTILEHEAIGLAVSVISCWEVAKLVELKRLRLEICIPDRLEICITEWNVQGLAYPGVRMLALSPEIAVEATQLPGEFHRDPSDQLLVATARVHDIPLMTQDTRILRYPHVTLVALDPS